MSYRDLTAFLYFNPDRFLVENSVLGNIDIDAFSRRFEYEPDNLAGFADFATDPMTTWATGKGDCEDYALFVASALKSRGVENVHLGFCYRAWPPAGHVVTFDDSRVYSSGAIFHKSFREYSKDWTFTRRRSLD